MLTPFPFSDLGWSKVRPAIVVSRSDRSDGDVIIAFITSNVTVPSGPADVLVRSTDPYYASTGLKRDSRIRLDKLVTVEKAILLGELGELAPELVVAVDEKLTYALGL